MDGRRYGGGFFPSQPYYCVKNLMKCHSEGVFRKIDYSTIRINTWNVKIHCILAIIKLNIIFESDFKKSWEAADLD